MQLTLLTHLEAVRVMIIVGITLVVLPILFYVLTRLMQVTLRKAFSRAAAVVLAVGCVVMIPVLYYFSLESKYGISKYSPADILYVAVENKNEAAVKRMLKKGAPPSEPTRFGECPFYRCVELGQGDMARLMLDSGADINYGAGNKTPLGAACMNGHIELARMLINSGADPDYKPEQYVSALTCAAAFDKGYNYHLIEILYQAGADGQAVSVTDKGRRMVPFKYYFTKANNEKLTDEDRTAYEAIAALYEQDYRDWVMENASFLISNQTDEIDEEFIETKQ